MKRTYVVSPRHEVTSSRRRIRECMAESRNRQWVPLLITSLLLSACAGAPEKPASERLAWPAAPLTTRIQFVRSIATEDDLKKDTTFSQELFNWLGGVKPSPKRVVEPMGLTVSDDGQRLYVSNFNRQAVFAFDFEQKELLQIEPVAHPVGLALDAEEQLYVVEQAKRQITVFDREGIKLRSITHPDIERPNGIAIDRSRNRIYLVDTGRSESSSTTKKGHNVKVFSLDGQLIKTLGSRGAEPGQFMFPTYVTLDASGNIYVTDTLNGRVQKFDPEGTYLQSFGERGNAWGMFDKPKGVAVDSFGNLYVTDSGWSNVQIFNQKGQVLLFFGGRGPIPGMLKNPTDISIDALDRIYVADFIHHRINVYQLVNTSAEDSFLNPPSAEMIGG